MRDKRPFISTLFPMCRCPRMKMMTHESLPSIDVEFSNPVLGLNVSLNIVGQNECGSARTSVFRRFISTTYILPRVRYSPMHIRIGVRNDVPTTSVRNDQHQSVTGHQSLFPLSTQKETRMGGIRLQPMHGTRSVYFEKKIYVKYVVQ